MRCVLVSASLLLATTPLLAQRITLGVEGALADYREQGAALRFTGSGFSGRAEVSVWRLSAQARMTRVHVDGASTNAEVTDAFDISQSELRLRMHVTPRIGVEAAALSRRMNPEHAAQSIQAWRAGGVYVQPLAPGADVAVRAGYLAATGFGGGGTAPFGLDVGLAVTYGPGAGRVRLTAEYEFQRVDRRTTVGGRRIDLPIQSAIARIGVAATFGPQT
jgi:hypothetical protein